MGNNEQIKKTLFITLFWFYLNQKFDGQSIYQFGPGHLDNLIIFKLGKVWIINKSFKSTKMQKFLREWKNLLLQFLNSEGQHCRIL